MDHYNGRGGRVRPLHRDKQGTFPNIAPNLISHLKRCLNTSITSEDLLAYIAGVVAHSFYTKRFRGPTPAVRVPITADPSLWSSAVELGQEVVWLHTYGERYYDATAGRPKGPPRLAEGKPEVAVCIPDDPNHMPERMSYDPERCVLRIGEGQIAPVSPGVMAYEVSGMKVVKHWFGYRKKNPNGKKTSPLDHVNADRWTPRMTTELLELLTVLERLVQLEPSQAELLDHICGGPLITMAELEEAGVLPVPESVRQPVRPEPQGAPSLFDASLSVGWTDRHT